jgi:hypothetical protein
MYNKDNTKGQFLHGKKIGVIDGESFVKEIRGSKHIMRKPHAIFFDIQSLRDVERLGCKRVRVTDKETGDIYAAELSLIWQHAIYKNYGYGEQVGLAVNLFTITRKDSGGANIGGVAGYEPATLSFTEYEKKHPTKAEKQVGQMSLFGGRG